MYVCMYVCIYIYIYIWLPRSRCRDELGPGAARSAARRAARAHMMLEPRWLREAANQNTGNKSTGNHNAFLETPLAEGTITDVTKYQGGIGFLGPAAGTSNN